MRKALIHRFFRELDRELGRPAEIIVTGAAAGALLGVVRPSVDIDFEIRPKSWPKAGGPFELREAIQRAAQRTKIAVNYSEDIGHWSMIDLLDYRRTARPYRVIGRLRVKIISPEYWTIGKMGRFYQADLRDVLRMTQRKRLKPKTLLPLWGRALRSSPLSPALGSFRRNVTYFIEHYGRKIWGKDFDPQKGVALFEKTAGIKYRKSKEVS